MGISYAILKNKELLTKELQKIYFSQLLVNLTWPVLFFFLNVRLIAFIWILFLIYLVINMIEDFKEVDILAGRIQVPYLIWISFAAILNYLLYIMNR